MKKLGFGLAGLLRIASRCDGRNSGDRAQLGNAGHI